MKKVAMNPIGDRAGVRGKPTVLVVFIFAVEMEDDFCELSNLLGHLQTFLCIRTGTRGRKREMVRGSSGHQCSIVSRAIKDRELFPH